MSITWPLGLPKSRAEIASVHSKRKRIAVQNALCSPFMSSRILHVDIDRLDDPKEWKKIPVLSKEELRSLSAKEFYRDFCIGNRSKTVEF